MSARGTSWSAHSCSVVSVACRVQGLVDFEADWWMDVWMDGWMDARGKPKLARRPWLWLAFKLLCIHSFMHADGMQVPTSVVVKVLEASHLPEDLA